MLFECDHKHCDFTRPKKENREHMLTRRMLKLSTMLDLKNMVGQNSLDASPLLLKCLYKLYVQMTGVNLLLYLSLAFQCEF